MKAADTVVFVGAGPGAADLLTRRAVDRLSRAEVVVHDQLVHPEVLALVPASADRISVDRREMTDDDPGRTTGDLLVRLAQAGRRVVRLKGGDPTVFARLAEEIEPVRQAGLAVEIVPGITAALAAAAVAGVPLTSRDAASSLTFVTGHPARGKTEPCDLTDLAAVPGTIVVYMGVEQIASWSRRLMDAGRSGETPVTLVSRCGWPDQRVASTTLVKCATDASHQGWRSPAVLLVGPAVAAPARGALAGQLVIVTRPGGQEGEVGALVRAAGGECLHVPVIRIAPPDDLVPIDAAIRQLGSFDWIVFTSTNGVRSFLDSMKAAGLDGRALGTARLASIGPATERSLEAAGYICDMTASSFRSEGLADALVDQPRGSRFLLVRAARGREVLRHSLEAAGHVVDEVTAYQSVPVEAIDKATEQLLQTAASPWLTVTSGAIAETSMRLFSPWIRSWRIASLSPVTSATLRRFGLEPTVEATEATSESLVGAMIVHERKNENSRGTPPARAGGLG